MSAPRFLLGWRVFITEEGGRGLSGDTRYLQAEALIPLKVKGPKSTFMIGSGGLHKFPNSGSITKGAVAVRVVGTQASPGLRAGLVFRAYGVGEQVHTDPAS